MAGGTAAHAAIQVNVITTLRTRLRGAPCRPYGSELKIAISGSVRYADAFVVCTPVPPQTKIVTDPVVVFEILSERSGNNDVVIKNSEYRVRPSIQHYVVLQQTHADATVFSRKGEDWVAEPVVAEGTLRLQGIQPEISLQDFYADVDLPPPPAED